MKTMDNNKKTGANSSVGMETTSKESAKVRTAVLHGLLVFSLGGCRGIRQCARLSSTLCVPLPV